MTLKVRPDVPSLRSIRLVREIERSFAAACERGDFRIVHYSLQSNHAHLLVEAHGHEALARGMGAIGSRLARAVNRVFGRRGRVLKERFHVRVLRTPCEVRRALAYVLLNARRHARRVLRAVGLDPASSARWFDGWRGDLEPPQRPGRGPWLGRGRGFCGRGGGGTGCWTQRNDRVGRRTRIRNATTRAGGRDVSYPRLPALR